MKFKFNDFTQITRSFSVAVPIEDKELLQQIALQILEKAPVEEKPVRLIGVGMSGFQARHSEDSTQLSLF